MNEPASASETRSPAGASGDGWRGWLWPALLIAVLGFSVVAGAWDAGFTDYDDTAHISGNPLLGPDVPLSRYFEAHPDEAYIPITTISWRVDRAVYGGWMPGLLDSWAPGVRTTNWLLHVLAALVLWRLLPYIGLSAGESLFVALVFAAHPTACESVAWCTERKNVLAAFFGFSAVWAWLHFREVWWMRVAAGFPLLALALMSKQSSLGILPLLALVDLFGGPQGLRGEPHPFKERRNYPWTCAAALVPVALLCALFVYLGIRGHRAHMSVPPGGNAFTALLTDTWIGVRYLGNLLAPVKLSAAYGIAPITGLASGTLWLALSILGAAAGFSLWAARSRLRAGFGWLWLIGALGPSLNIVALPFLMSDRYIYLSLPGCFIILVEVAAGLHARLGPSPESKPQAPPGRTLLIAAAGYVLLLGVLSVQRGTVWRSTYSIFADAVAAEPRSAFARFSLGVAHAQAWLVFSSSKQRAHRALAAEAEANWIAQWEAMFDETVDADRQLKRGEAAYRVGDYYQLRGELDKARRFFGYAADESPGLVIDPHIVTLARQRLAEIETSAR